MAGFYFYPGLSAAPVWSEIVLLGQLVQTALGEMLISTSLCSKLQGGSKERRHYEDRFQQTIRTPRTSQRATPEMTDRSRAEGPGFYSKSLPVHHARFQPDLRHHSCGFVTRLVTNILKR